MPIKYGLTSKRETSVSSAAKARNTITSLNARHWRRHRLRRSPSSACADSRVSPELLFDKGLGDLFVVRNAGNSPDPIAIGSLEYAVEHLGSKVIVVLGHQSCGAVKAACSDEKMPTANLEAVVAPIAAACSAHKGDLTAAIKDHVHQSAQELVSHSPVLKHEVEEGKIKVIEAYYELDTGKVIRLN